MNDNAIHFNNSSQLINPLGKITVIIWNITIQIDEIVVHHPLHACMQIGPT